MKHELKQHGARSNGAVVDLMVSGARREELLRASRHFASMALGPRQLGAVELLMTGALAPLQGFMGSEEVARVQASMRLPDGTPWPTPITLRAPAGAAPMSVGDRVALRDSEGVMVAVLRVSEVFEGATEAGNHERTTLLAGRVEGLVLPAHYDFRMLRHTPATARALFARRGWRRIMAYAPKEVMHRPQVSAAFRLAREHQTNLLIMPRVAPGEDGDLGYYARVRCHQASARQFPRHTVELVLVPAGPRSSGMRGALLGALVARNYGATHVAVSPSAWGVSRDPEPPEAVREQLRVHGEALGVELVPWRELVYHRPSDRFLSPEEVPEGDQVERPGARALAQVHHAGKEAQARLSYPEVIRELQRTFPPRGEQGFTVFFTGLSGAGKSTIAHVLRVRLLELGGRPVTLLDGDIVRRHLSSELTFSKAHRDINIRRIGFVAAEITKNRGIAICAPIAPYAGVRDEVRRRVSARGGFVLVHVATPLEVCERRDRKGMYAKARAGLVKEFTGISDPYERPTNAEVVIDTEAVTPLACAQQVLLYLEKAGYIGSGGAGSW